MFRRTAILALVPLLTVAACSTGNHRPGASEAASASAQAGHASQFARSWAAAVASRKAEAAQFTEHVEVAVKPFGITALDLVAAAYPTGVTSGCRAGYSLTLPKDRFGALPARLEAVLKSAGWRSSGSDPATGLVPLVWHNWRTTVAVTPESDAVAKAMGVRGPVININIQAGDCLEFGSVP